MRRFTIATVKVTILLLAFVITPVAYGFIGLVGASGAVYAPADDPTAPTRPAAPPIGDLSKPTAVVLMSQAGSEVTDVLAPYEVLARSGAFNVYAVAPDPTAVPLGSGLDVLPQLTLAELDARLAGKAPDLIAVPAMNGVGTAAHARIRDWLRNHVDDATLLLAICNGSEVLADAGLLDGRTATANWAALDEYAVRFPAVDWVRGVRYVEASDLISTAGITSGVNGTLRAVARFVGERAAIELAQQIGYPDPRIGSAPVIEQRRLEPADAGIVILEAAYDWGRPTIGVGLAPGVGEIEVASIIDVHGGDAYATRTTTVAVDGAELVQSEHGLWFAPRATLDKESGLDRLLVPGVNAADARDASFEARAGELGLRPEYIHDEQSTGERSFSFDAPLRDLAARSSVAAATLTAKALEYPLDHLRLEGPAWPWQILFGPVFVGIVGVLVVACLWRAARWSLRVARSAQATRRIGTTGPARRVGTFVLHAVEMVIAMVAGMALLGFPISVIARAFGIDDLYHEAPLLGAVVMTAIMTVPMAAWMSVRGHDRTMITEMSLAMVVPTIVLLASAIVGLIAPEAIMSWQDPLMYLAMLGVMVVRWDMYSGGSHSRHLGATPPVAAHGG